MYCRRVSVASLQITSTMPRDGATILSDLIGKLDMLRVSCGKCHRSGRSQFDFRSRTRTAVFFFLRQPRRPNALRPVQNGNAAGKGSWMVRSQPNCNCARCPGTRRSLCKVIEDRRMRKICSPESATTNPTVVFKDRCHLENPRCPLRAKRTSSLHWITSSAQAKERHRNSKAEGLCGL